MTMTEFPPQLIINPVASPTMINAIASQMDSPVRWTGTANGLWNVATGTVFVRPTPPGFNVLAEIRRVVHRANDVIVYQIITDRFRKGSRRKKGLPNVDPGRRDYTMHFGGDFAGIESALPFLSRLGVTAIWPSPVQANAPGKSGLEGITGYHGYWVNDWFRLNPHFTSSGDAESLGALRSFVEMVHSHGLDVYLDVIIHHGPPKSTPGRAAIFMDGEFMTDYDKDSEISSGEFGDEGPEFFSRDDVPPPNKEQAYLHYPEIKNWPKPYEGELTDGNLLDLATINPTNPRITGMIFEAYRQLFELTGAGGVRIDAVKHMRPDYVMSFVRMLMEINPLLRVIGEYFNASLYNQECDGCTAMARKAGMSFLDFGLQYLIYNAFRDPTMLYMDLGHRRRLDARNPLLVKIANYIRLMNESPDVLNYALSSYIWLDNHDLPRFLNADKDDLNAHQKGHKPKNPETHAQDQAMLLLTCMPGRLVFYYGQEKYLKGPNVDGFWGPASDPYNRPWYGKIPPDDHPGVIWMKKLTSLRHKNPALTSGTITLIEGRREDTLAFKREFMENEVFYWHNRGRGYYREFKLGLGWPDGTYADPMTGEIYSVREGTLTIPAIPRRQRGKGAMDIDYRTIVLALNGE